MTIQKIGRGLLIYTVAFASAFTTRYVVRSIRNSTTWSTSEIQSKTQFESNINNKNLVSTNGRDKTVKFRQFY